MEPEVNEVQVNKPRLSVSAIVMIVLSCLFGTVALIPFVFEGILSWASIDLLFNGENNLGAALGMILLFVYAIIVGIVTVCCGVICLPFNIILLKKVGKKWYSLTLLIVTIVIIVFALLMMFAFPILSNVAPSSSSSSSMDSSSISAII